jgi:NADH-quinone oxidoreductase subunit J
MLSTLFIYSLYTLIITSSLGVWMAKSCVLAVFFLALIFTLAALLLFILGAEFLAVLLLIIYSGAIILLFLFIVFLLNLRVLELYNIFTYYLPVGASIGLLFLVLVLFALSTEYSISQWPVAPTKTWGDHPSPMPNIVLFGYVLYEHKGFFVVAVAFLLLTIMVAAIVLSLDFRRKSRPWKNADFNNNQGLPKNSTGGGAVSTSLWSPSPMQKEKGTPPVATYVKYPKRRLSVRSLA